MKIFAAILLIFSALILNVGANPAKQTNFDVFWKKFKSAVAKSDKTAVAAMVKFPVSMSYGVASIKSKAAFIKRYDEIFNDEVDVERCFAKNAPQKSDAKNYVVSCSFKGEPEDENAPFAFRFELTKSGWKFVSFDNINE
ncbi:MAG: hypothetical protein H7Z37_08055 [Pyrinomonadaceae bacterium]|nr:hypothetical protein [Pyrinomonadaceae bacterium]